MGWRDQSTPMQQAARRPSWRDQSTPEQSVEPEQPDYTEEQQKDDWLAANRERMSAQAYKTLSESNLPSFKAGMIQVGAGILSPAARLIGKGEWADQINRFSGAVEQAQQEMEKGGIVPDVLQRGVRGAGVSLGTAVPAGAVAGPYGAIAAFSAQEGSRAVTAGRDVGLKGAELAGHVARQATIEAVPAIVMQRIGLGGLESIVGGKQAVASGLKAGLKQAGKTLAQELPEELVTEIAHSVESSLSGVDPEAMSAESIKRTVLDTVVQTALVTGAASAPGVVAARKQGKQEKVRTEILEAAESGEIPSRKKFKSWGITDRAARSRAERKEAVQEIAAGIKAADQAESDAAAAPQIDETVEVDPLQARKDAAREISPEAAFGQEEAAPTAETTIETPEAPQALEQATAAPEDATSLANVPVAEQRAARGEETVLPTAEPETFEQWLDTAQKEIAESPSLPGRLVKELNEKPRNLSNIETAVLQVQYRTLNDEFGAVSDELIAAQESGRQSVIDQAQAKSNEVLQELRDIETASKKAGTEAGRGLAARRMAIRRDYTLGSVVRRLRTAKGGKQLSEVEMATAKKTSEEALALEAEQATLDESIEVQDSEAGTERFIERSKKPKKGFKRDKEAATKTAEAKQRVSDAMADFKAKLAKKKPDGTVGQFLGEEKGAVDLELAESGLNLVKAYADLGVSTFAEFFANVKSQLGDAAMTARGSLRAAWAQAQEIGLIDKPEIDPGDVRGMSRFAKQVARSVVESGVTARDEVVDAVHEELQTISPDISRRDTMDAISGYGIYTELSKDEASATLRDLSGQLRQLAKLEDIQSGKVPKKTGAERRTLSEEEARLTEQVQEAMRESGLDAVDDAARTETYKRMLTKKIADLERRMAESDFSKPAKRKTKLDADATALKYKAQVLRKRLDAMEERFRNSQLKGFKKLYRYTGETSNLGRAMKTAFDLSGLLRQGKYAVAANPRMAKKSIVSMVRAYWSKELAFNDAEAVRNNPDAPRAAQGGLAITEPEGKLTEQEEVFRGEWAKYIPGVAGAERAYAAGLNSLRMDYFSQLLRDIEAGGLGREAGKATDAEVKAIANVVNVFTGRGSYKGQNQAAAQFLSTYFFSPRFVISRFQLLAGQPLVQGSMRTRKLIAREYARSMGSMATIYSLAAIAGYFALSDEDKPKFEWNPQSTEFAKIRFGDVVLDPAAGVAQVMTFTSRIAPDWMGGGMTKSSTGEIVPIRGPDVPFKGTSVLDVWVRFFQSKLAPLPAALLNANVGENVIGEETDLVHELLTLPVPLSFGDIYDALQADGYSTKAALATLALFGDGVNRYQNANPAKFAKKITLHPELEGVSKTTGKEFSYTEAVEQMVAEAKKRGITLDQLIQALDEEMRGAGKSTKAIRGKKKLLRRRF